MSQKILVVDTETTGLGHSIEIVELAFIQIDESLTVISEHNFRVKPGIPISPGASGVHGITDDMVSDCPALEEVLCRFPEDFFSDIFLIGHNISFDKRLLDKYWNVTGQLCTLKAARNILPLAPDHKLQTLRYFLNLPVPKERGHGAYVDTLVTFHLLSKLLEISGDSLVDFVDTHTKTQVLTLMPWGKHKGQALTSLPKNYVQWLLTLPDLDKDLRSSLKI